jgi:hypothetical protein
LTVRHTAYTAKEGFRECDPSAKPQGRGCIFENNKDVMAMGNLIRPVHSTPFLFGLRAVTGLDWEYWTPHTQEAYQNRLRPRESLKVLDTHASLKRAPNK